MPTLPWQPKKYRTLEEAQADDELATVELSLAQKRAAIKRLEAAGLSGSHFSWNWAAIKNWLKNH